MPKISNHNNRPINKRLFSLLYSEKWVILISVILSIILFSLKIYFGLVAESRALLYDGYEKLSDLVILVFLGNAIRISRKPADIEHQYGHGKVECLASLFVGLAFSGFGLFLAYNALLSIAAGRLNVPNISAFYVAILSVIIKQFLYFYSISVSKKTGSMAIRTIALDSQKDSLISLVAVVGTLSFLFKAPLVDTGAATVTALIIFYLGVKVIYDSSQKLLDIAPDKRTVVSLKEVIGSIEGVKRVKSIKARTSGKNIYVDTTIEVDSQISVKKGHIIATGVRNKLINSEKNIKDVVVHVEPYLD